MFYIRVDANEFIGTGHVMRCLSIAEEFRRRGELVTFLVADNCSEKIIVSKGFQIICLHSAWDDLDKEVESLISVIETMNISVLLIDSYYVTENYLGTVRKYTKTIYIDDVDAFLYPVDLLVNYNIYAEDLCYKERYQAVGLGTQFALGCSYVPLREEFSNVNKEIKEKVSNILITSGGTDTYNAIGNILEALCGQAWFDELEYHIILGRFNVHIEELKERWKQYENVHLLTNVSNMSEYMKCCDIAITAGGVTTYELCACGIPSIMYTLADNQLQIAQTVSEKKLIPWVGDVRENIENCMNLIILYMRKMSSVDERREKSMKVQKIIDGNGCKRVVDYIIDVLS
ncbi:MAG: UDP-2,4-diacetamido-2,4,6-trideoxy-beta-L-altropyranose hydrolase [Clostridium sp.]|nr:UDP-2,4-diacetamido-2,4,6-trideoxy-beta-L-altropyranose hydrolase [Clostridium sp.]